MEEKVDSSFDTILIDVLIVMILLEDRVETICNDRLGSELFDEIRLIRL